MHGQGLWLSHDQVLDAGIALAERLASKPAVALLNVKRAAQRGFSLPLSEALNVVLAMNAGYLLTRAAQRYPDRPAWRSGEVSISYREAEGRVNRLSNALLSLGGEPGDRVGMLLPNCYQGLEAILAPIRVGMAAVPINIRLHPQEVQYILNDSQAFALIYGEEFQAQVEQMRESLPKVKSYICVGKPQPGARAYEAILSSSASIRPDPHIQPDDLAWIFYTSGTTGKAKGAMLTHRNLLTMAEMFLTDINPAQPTDVILHAAPITHGSGLCLFHHLARGAANAIPTTRSFDPPAIFRDIQAYRVTTMFLVPTQVNLLVASPAREQYDLSSLHTLVYGGAPMYTNPLLEALGAFGNVFVQLFGQGEAPMTITTLPKEEHLVDNDPVRMERLASAGREVTGVRVRIVDDQDGVLPHGQVGEIVVRSDLVMKGYLNRPEATAETLRGGWLHTGDLGHMDADGYLYITDRKKDMIISGGANIYPREAEEVISRHPAVAEVAIIGVPDPKWGEAVKALVVVLPGMQVTGEEIINFCRQHMASYRKPQSVEFLPSLPKNAYGKVLKRELRERYWKGQERRV